MFQGINGALGGLFGSDEPGRPMLESNKVKNVLSPGGPSMGSGGTGMFGIQGQARDLLGGLGDLWLMRQGLDPQYRNQQRGQVMADSVGGNSADAIRQLYEMGAIEEAQGMQEQNIAQKDDLTTQATRRLTAQQSAQQDALELEDSMLERAANFYASVTDEASFQRANQLVNRYFSTRGVATDRLPTNFEEARDFSAFNYTPSQRVDDERAARDLESNISSREARVAQGEARVAQGEARVQQGAARTAASVGRTAVLNEATRNGGSGSSSGSRRARPRVGQVVNGHRYVGGNPNSASSWRQVGN